MPNLLQKASIVLTPTAYDDGKVLCAKPSEAPYGDFDFSRNSAATRVNAQGLVENVQTLSGNLVQNGDFSEQGAEEVSNGSFSQQGSELVTNGDFSTDSDWSKGTGWSISGALNAADTTSTAFQINTGIVSGKTYKVTYTISNYVSGSVRIELGSSNVSVGIIRSANGTYTEYIVALGDETIYFDGIVSFTGSIDNVSVVEVGQDWNLGTGWSIGDDKAIFDGSGYSAARTNAGLITGKTYKVTFDLSITSGNIVVQLGGATNIFNTTATHTFYDTATANVGYDAFVSLYSTQASNFSITNISVKEVGQNWEFNSTAIITNDGMNITTGGFIRQDVVEIGKKYKLTYDIVSYTVGSVRLYDGTNQGSIPTNLGSNTFNFTAGGSNFIIQSNSVNLNLTITNISVIEITDDTNLPRINYEGFSYQDALGSELVTNGSFDTDSDWNKGTGITIGSGVALFTSVSSGLQLSQSSTPAISGKTYKISYEIKTRTEGAFSASIGGTLSSNQNSAVGVYTEYLTATGVGIFYIRSRGTTSGSIDNVSVKEYLGQEVVPDSGCGSWLFEPQSTNLIPYSEDFSQWNSTSVTITPNQVIAPDGMLTADKIIDNSTNSHHRITDGNTTSSSGSFTYSIFLKKGTLTTAQIQVFNSGTASSADVDLVNGTITSGGQGVNHTIQNYGNDWFKCSISGTLTNTDTTVYLYLKQKPSYIGNGDYLYAWGAQLEQQSYATSYIPTSGTSVTRNQDVCNNGGSVSTINSTGGVLYGEFSSNASDNNSNWINISDGTANNWLFIGRDYTNVRAYIRANNVVIFSNSATPLAENNKVALSYKSGEIKLYINGIQKLNLTNVFSFTSVLNQLNFNAYNGGGTTTQMAWKSVAVWKEALSDEELTLLTAPAPVAPTFTLDFDEIANQFTFSRASFGTIVNEQGLIETVSNIGPEEVVNGDFSDGTNNWQVEGFSTIVVGDFKGKTDVAKININNASTGSRIIQPFNYVSGKTYKVDIEVYVESGNFRLDSSDSFVSGDFVSTSTLGSWQTLTANITAISTGSNYIWLRSISGISEFYISKVSVKEVIEDDIPRIDYSTGTEAFLLEPQSTNLIPYSEDFSNSSWKNESIGTTPILNGGYLAPDGTNNAFKISNVNQDSFWYTFTSGIGASTSRSIYARTVSGTGTAQLLTHNSNTNNTFTITEQWQRFEINNVTSTIGQSSLYAVDFRGSTTLSEIILWGVNATNDQDYATSYIPTSGTSVTRVGETCVNATPEINSEEGTLYFEGSALVEGEVNRHISLGDGTYNNYLTLRYSADVGRFQGFLKSNGGANNSLSSVSNVQTDNNKIALVYKTSEFSMWLNGSKVSTMTPTAMPIGLDELALGWVGANLFYGNTKDLQYFNEALSDYQLAQLTTI